MLPPLAAMKSAVGISVYLTSNVIRICTEGNPSAEIIDEYVNNGRQVETTLHFDTILEIDTRTKYAFIFVTVGGEARLMGAKEKPYPVITKKRNTGTPGSVSAVNQYEVKWISNAEPARVHIVEPT